jgi:hypothetical protein
MPAPNDCQHRPRRGSRSALPTCVPYGVRSPKGGKGSPSARLSYKGVAGIPARSSQGPRRIVSRLLFSIYSPLKFNLIFDGNAFFII